MINEEAAADFDKINCQNLRLLIFLQSFQQNDLKSLTLSQKDVII